MAYLVWPHKTAVGSSYCFDQSPGGERYGGLTLTIRRPTAQTGTITVNATDRDTGEPLDVPDLVKSAQDGVREAARELGVSLDQIDIVTSEFAFHDVDSSRPIFYGAARSAFRATWETWQRFYNSSSNEDQT
jgi:hypothetical protein